MMSNSFLRLVHAEWTKFRTVRGWIVGVVIAALVMVSLGLFTALASPNPCSGGTAVCLPPTGPDGLPVIDGGNVVSRTLTGDGSITVRVTSLTSRVPSGGPPASSDRAPQGTQSGLVPWSKAGILMRQSSDTASRYVAIMATGSHGVRMQHNYVHDRAGSPVVVSDVTPQWLRLTRTGDAITGYESPDGITWRKIGAVTLNGLPSTVQAGMFAASPEFQAREDTIVGVSSYGGPSQTTGVFDNVRLEGAAGADWRSASSEPLDAFEHSGDTFSLRASHDLGPVAANVGQSVEYSLGGVFAALIAVIVIATLFMTSEFRRGVILTTFAAEPRRGRVLTAKALVVGSVVFVAGLIAAAVSLLVGTRIFEANGLLIYPVDALTEVRVIVGSATLLALTAVFALSVGAIVRRSAGAITGLVVLTLVPYMLATAAVLPTAAAQWLLRLTPAAAFAVQQSVPEYSQLDFDYEPWNGYFPLAPFVGLAVLGVYTAVAFCTALVLLRRRDA